MLKNIYEREVQKKMKLIFDLKKSAMTGKVQVQRMVTRGGTTFPQHFWVNPSDVKDTDVVIGGNKGLSIMTQEEFNKKYPNGGMQDPEECLRHNGSNATWRGEKLQNPSVMKRAKEEYKQFQEDKKALEQYKKKADTKTTDKPVNIDDFQFTNYKNPDGQNTTNRKTYKDAMKDWAGETEKQYERALKNYSGDTPPAKQLEIAFMNLNRESSIRDMVSNSSESGLKAARGAIYARQARLMEDAKEYTKWDRTKGGWVKETSKDSVPDKAVGKTWSDTKTELGKMGYKVDSVFSSNPPQPKEKLTLYKDGKTYEAEVTKYHNGDYEILGSSIKEVKDDNKSKDTPVVTNFKNGFVRYSPDGEKPPYHGGKTYNYFASRKGDAKGKYFDTKEEAEDYVNGTGSSSDKPSDNSNSKFDASEFTKLKSDRPKALQYLKDKGITWKETDNEGINWMRACMSASRASNSDASTTKKDSTSKSSSDSKPSGKASEEAKKSVKDLLSANGNDRVKTMQAAKDAGVTWKESDNAGINWMRASLAIQKHYESGKSIDSKTNPNTPDYDKMDLKTLRDKRTSLLDTIHKLENAGRDTKDLDDEFEKVDKALKSKLSSGKKDATKSDNKTSKYDGGDHSNDSFSKFLEFTKTDSHAAYLLERIEEARDAGKSVGRTESHWVEELKKYCGYEMVNKTQSKNSDSTSNVKQLKPTNMSTRDEFDIHSKVRKGELSKTPISDSDKEMIKNIVPNYKSVLKESDTRCTAYSKNREYRFTKLSDSHFKCEVYEISNKKDTSRPIKTSWYETN